MRTEIPAWMAGVGTHEMKLSPAEAAKQARAPKMRAVSFTLTEGAVSGLEKASRTAGKSKSEFLREYLEGLQ